jgi:hypothetical protein
MLRRANRAADDRNVPSWHRRVAELFIGSDEAEEHGQDTVDRHHGLVVQAADERSQLAPRWGPRLVSAATFRNFRPARSRGHGIVARAGIG